jgi:hypothetical protein
MDTMKKQTLIYIVLLLALISNQTKGQAIKVQSFDGIAQVINVIPDYDRETLTIATMQDTLHIRNCTNVEEVNALNKNFIKIIYQVRGGSGIHLRHMLIVTAKDNKLYQALHITSLFSEEFIDFNKKPVSSTPDKSSHYEVKISFVNDSYPNLKIAASISIKEASKANPQSNYTKQNNVILAFDTTNNIFYSSIADVSQHFTIHDPKTRQESKQYVMGAFPMLQLGSLSYYYIKGGWYEKDQYDNLLKYAYK